MRAVCLSLLLYVSHGYVEFPSSCIGEEDGSKWIKPLEGDLYPPINQLCDNEYMVIDLNRDANVEKYLSSLDSWHYALSGSRTHAYTASVLPITLILARLVLPRPRADGPGQLAGVVPPKRQISAPRRARS